MEGLVWWLTESAQRGGQTFQYLESNASVMLRAFVSRMCMQMGGLRLKEAV